MNLIKFFVLALSVYMVQAEAFIINNKSGKTLAVFFHNRDQVFPSEYYEYSQASIKEGREKPIKNFEESKCFIIKTGKTEIDFQEGVDELIIVDHELAVKDKIKINSSTGNMDYDYESKVSRAKSSTINLKEEKEKLIGAILEVTLDNAKDSEWCTEFLKINFKSINNDSAFTAFLHQATNLCVIS